MFRIFTFSIFILFSLASIAAAQEAGKGEIIDIEKLGKNITKISKMSDEEIEALDAEAIEELNKEEAAAEEKQNAEEEAAEAEEEAEKETAEEPEQEEKKKTVKKQTKKQPVVPVPVKTGALLSPDRYDIHFVQGGSIGADTALLRITSPAVIAGCSLLTPPSFEKQIQGDRIVYVIEGPGVTVDNSKGANGKCPNAARTASVDIPVSRSELERRRISKIGLKSANLSETFDVHLSGHQLSLIPSARSSMRAFRPDTMPSGNDPLTHWFLPENTVALYVPAAKNSDDFAPQIQKLARAQGLIPLESVIDGYSNPVPGIKALYFVDMPGYFVRRTGRDDAPVVFGKVQAERQFFSGGTQQIRSESLDVYARRL